jgi:hypothetical protein
MIWMSATTPSISEDPAEQGFWETKFLGLEPLDHAARGWNLVPCLRRITSGWTFERECVCKVDWLMRLASTLIDGIGMSAQREGEGKELLRPPCVQVSYATNVKVNMSEDWKKKWKRSLSLHTRYKESYP